MNLATPIFCNPHYFDAHLCILHILYTDQLLKLMRIAIEGPDLSIIDFQEIEVFKKSTHINQL